MVNGIQVEGHPFERIGVDQVVGKPLAIYRHVRPGD